MILFPFLVCPRQKIRNLSSLNGERLLVVDPLGMGGNAVAFSAPERDVYMRVHNDAKAEFEKHSQRGAQFVAKHLLAIMSLLNPLRAICSGGVPA